MTFDWSIVWELTLLSLGGAALWLYFGLGWHRLHRAPRRRQILSPIVGGALLVAMIIAGQLGAMIAANIVGIEIGGEAAAELPLREMAQMALGMYAAQAIVLIAYVHLQLKARRPLNDNRMKPGVAVAMGIASLVLFWPMVYVVGWAATLLMTMLSMPVDPVAHDTLAMLITSPRDAWLALMICLVVIAAPVLEEVLYRGILQETLGQLGFGNWTAVIVTSAIFAVMHATVVPGYALVSLFVLSLGFGWVYEKTGRLAAPIAMHMLFNAGNVLLATLVA